jgi:DNA-directed RNA polymerase subunit RPC12/RpoP
VTTPAGPDSYEDSYVWPTCLACGRNLWDDELDRYACQPCEDGTRTRLQQLPNLFTHLNQTVALIPGARKTNGSTPTGSRTAPLPVRLDVLDLTGPGGIATRLQAIEDSWRKALGRRITAATDGIRVFASWRTNPTRAVPGHIDFLTINLRRACEVYESIGQDIDGIRKLHATCKAAADGERRSGKVPVGLCPTRTEDGVCATPLTATASSHRVRCNSCGSRWESMAEWRTLKAAQEQILAEAAVAA